MSTKASTELLIFSHPVRSQLKAGQVFTNLSGIAQTHIVDAYLPFFTTCIPTNLCFNFFSSAKLQQRCVRSSNGCMVPFA